MANNPNVNKVVLGSQTLIDLTNDTVTSDSLLQGYTAHDKSGAAVTGTVKQVSVDTTLTVSGAAADSKTVGDILAGGKVRIEIQSGEPYLIYTV